MGGNPGMTCPFPDCGRPVVGHSFCCAECWWRLARHDREGWLKLRDRLAAGTLTEGEAAAEEGKIVACYARERR